MWNGLSYLFDSREGKEKRRENEERGGVKGSLLGTGGGVTEEGEGEQ